MTVFLYVCLCVFVCMYLANLCLLPPLFPAVAVGAQQSSITPGGSGNWQCPHEFGHYPHDTACDKYYSCEGGVATLKTCGNGLAFDATDPDFLRENCDYKHNVDCSARPELGRPASAAEAMDTHKAPRSWPHVHGHMYMATRTRPHLHIYSLGGRENTRPTHWSGVLAV